MPAQSVTGLYNNGVGSVGANNKGSDRASLSSSKLIGPHTIIGGRVTLSGGVATVTFGQPLSGSNVNYVVSLTSINSAVNSNETVVSSLSDNSDSNFESFSIAGTGSQSVMYVVTGGLN